MKFLDLILYNTYTFLKFINSSTIYSDNYDAKLHSFIVAKGLFSMNIFNLFSFSSHYFLNESMPRYLFYASTVIVFLLFYLVYFKNKRFDKVLKEHKVNFLGITITLIYVIATIYIFIKYGDYLRATLSRDQFGSVVY
jgi:TRAP-type uncharacterized transport system fused permease subunit